MPLRDCGKLRLETGEFQPGKMVDKMMELTILVEDGKPTQTGLESEHGLSVLVEADGQIGLFDTGQSDAVVRNAERLGMDLEKLSWIALSHGHYDHTGGLEAVLHKAREATVYLHPAALAPKLVIENDEIRNAGMKMTRAQLENTAADVVCAEGPTQISPNLHLTGTVPRHTAYETVDQRFATRDAAGNLVHDIFPDDQSLILQSGSGLIVVCGCAHAGLVNILRYTAELFPGQSFRGIVGGLHLHSASDKRVMRTTEELQRFSVQELWPNHCTGANAIEYFCDIFFQRVMSASAGTHIVI